MHWDKERAVAVTQLSANAAVDVSDIAADVTKQAVTITVIFHPGRDAELLYHVVQALAPACFHLKQEQPRVKGHGILNSCFSRPGAGSTVSPHGCVIPVVRNIDNRVPGDPLGGSDPGESRIIGAVVFEYEFPERWIDPLIDQGLPEGASHAGREIIFDLGGFIVLRGLRLILNPCTKNERQKEKCYV